MPKKNTVIAIGRTGDGKTALCKQLVRLVAPSAANPFKDADGAESDTQECLSVVVTDLEVVDTPGLMDSNGVARDEAHLRAIVDKVRTYPRISAIVLVVNEQADRFDAGMQDAVKLLVDSFGPDCLSCMGIMFTKAFGDRSIDQARARAAEIAQLIHKRTGFPVAFIPCWQYDAYPERQLVAKLRRHMSPEAIAAAVDEATQESAQALRDAVSWIRTQRGMGTQDVKYGEYELVKKARLAREAEAKAAKEAEEARRAAAVVHTDTETVIECFMTEKVPIIQQVTRSTSEPSTSGLGAATGGLVGTALGGPVGTAVGTFVGEVFNLLGGGKPATVTEAQHVGDRTARHMREKKRTVQTLGDGRKIKQDWETVREWREE